MSSLATRVSTVLPQIRFSRRSVPITHILKQGCGSHPQLSPPASNRSAILLLCRSLSSNSSSGSNSNSGSNSTVSGDGNGAGHPATHADTTAVNEKDESRERRAQDGFLGKLVYEGSMAQSVRGLKRVSITTCLISILGVPALAMFGKENVPMAGQVAVMGTALAGTGCSTLLLNLCVSPYVFRMIEVLNEGDEDESGGNRKNRKKKNRYGMLKPTGRRFKAERVNIFGIQKSTEFSLDEVEPMPNTSRPFVSFKAGDDYYFIHGHEMADKELLRTLLGRELKDHEK